MPIIRKLLRGDGSTMDLPAGKSAEWLRNLIGAESLHPAALRLLTWPLHVLLIDVRADAKGLPVNAEATRLYLDNCNPTTWHKIRGDAVVVPAAEVEGLEP